MLTGLYAEFFRFPSFEHRIAPGCCWSAAGPDAGHRGGRHAGAILATVRLAPAEAMRPPAPGRYRRTLLERLGMPGRRTALRMILRNMERRPWRTAVDRRRGGGGGHRHHGQLLPRRDRGTSSTRSSTLAMRSDVAVWLPSRWTTARGSNWPACPGVTRSSRRASCP
jgi:putative ABC transport system permease protein